MNIENLKQFYDLINNTKKIREKIVYQYFKGNNVDSQLINSLHEALYSFKNIAKKDGKYSLELNKNKNIYLDITYEIEELKKDIFFLEHSEDDFFSYLDKLHVDFLKQVKECEKLLKQVKFINFITDRDGTTNNYCGRYKSSIQSIYNSIFLTRFALNSVKNSIIITSAPLDNFGLVDISINPENVFIYAGSKGREYFDKKGIRKQFPIEKEKQKILDLLNKRLTELVNQPEYEIFSLIGSGLQFKFGQTTISHQDIYNSITFKDSKNFINIVKNIVNEIDPEREYFIIEDTGKDLEIILTIKNSDDSDNLKDFDKGDGVEFLNDELNLNIEKGPNLICGDTKSDIPMLIASIKKTNNTWAIFVTEDNDLKQEVIKICPNSLFVSNPDVLVTILNKLSVEVGKLRS
ncbi:MAG: trehalose 6-phosphate synthase [Spirochaetes bacterium]|nr:trehalose 6-phosphate synthase [Spirochaetota bacterium]